MRKVKLGILMLSGMAVFLSAFSQEKIYIDCFGANGGAGWNNVNITAAGTSSPLNTSENTASGITLSVSNRMTTGTWTVSSGSYAGDALEFLPSGSNGAFGSVPAWGTHPPVRRRIWFSQDWKQILPIPSPTSPPVTMMAPGRSERAHIS
ncbi:MAG: hypothetical protein PHO37_08575 [Kiritimatiellae bacterium]|nr:hypothetical protein [Kiritimatiellia bacterium]